MKFARLLVTIVVALAVTGCTCRTRQVGPSNVPPMDEASEIADIHFAFDSYELSQEALEIARNAAVWLSHHPEKSVKLEGHCDERGTTEYNMVLGNNRARAVYEYLRSLGVEDSRMTPVSYGEEFPLDPGHNEEAWAKNRRVHFAVE